MFKKVWRAIRKAFQSDDVLAPPHQSTARSVRRYDSATWPERMPRHPFA